MRKFKGFKIGDRVFISDLELIKEIGKLSKENVSPKTLTGTIFDTWDYDDDDDDEVMYYGVSFDNQNPLFYKCEDKSNCYYVPFKKLTSLDDISESELEELSKSFEADKVTKPTNKVYWSKVKPNAIIPTKLGENAGYDIYACFDGIDENYILIKPHETVMIPTGIASAFDKKWGAKLTERGSTGTKGIGQRAGLIDSGYRGEWMCPITNHSEKTLVIIKETEEEFLRNEKGNTDKDIILYPSSKAICQATFYEVPVLESEEISYDELKNIKSVRGDGKLGSSGK